MWAYIVRRLLAMIPTLFGVTVVAFCVMQLAPGDPLKKELGMGEVAGESSETREAYLVRRRDLKLDKPLILNFHYFRDYTDRVAMAAHYRALREEAIARELNQLAEQPDNPVHAARLKFLRSLGIGQFDQLLANPKGRRRLAAKVVQAVQVYCEDLGVYGVRAAVAVLRDAEDREAQIGAIRCLSLMVPDPFMYTYPREATKADTPKVVATWQIWWKRAEANFARIDPDRRKVLQREFDAMVASDSRSEIFEALENFERDDMRFFAEKLLGESSLKEKEIAAAALKLYIGHPLLLSVPPDADARAVADVSENWLVYFDLQRDQYQPGWLRKTGYVLTDTQYAHMVWRLITFDFGRSTTKTREPVLGKIIAAVLVSAPLMIMAQITIYLLAVPLGIVCAVNRANWVDRAISLGLFLLYSIPPFVAGMLFLLLFCYGDYVKWFPMLGLHSPGAEQFGFVDFFLDYLWHAILPVTCLSLFSLAAMAMYSRTSMLDVIGQDYIRTARAKGVSEPKVILKHGLRNALIPIITLFAGFLPAMLGGSVLIEYLFGIPGMGRLSWESIELKDIPTLMALIYIDAIVVMLSILLTDMLYVFVDPRISFERKGQAA